MYGPIRTQRSSSGTCEVAGSDNPYQSIFRSLYPVFGEESGEGGLLIKVHQANPFSGDQNKPMMTNSATWYPPGSRREYINQYLATSNAPREKFMQQPHTDSFISFAHPSYRRHGIADLLLEEQCRRADELGLEACLGAAAAMGVPIFIPMGLFHTRRVMERKMQPLRVWPMWRPKGGKFMPGETRLPRDGGLSTMFSKL
ncbi:hypothetical protein BDW75DRAFT_235347 [Aspergillus navahoensis]